MENSSNQDKREAVRYPENVNIMVRLITSPGDVGEASGFMCPLKNISEKGVCFQSKNAIEPGQTLEMWIKIKSTPEAVILYAEARRSTSEADGAHHEIGAEINPESNAYFEKWKRAFGEPSAPA